MRSLAFSTVTQGRHWKRRKDIRSQGEVNHRERCFWSLEIWSDLDTQLRTYITIMKKLRGLSQILHHWQWPIGAFCTIWYRSHFYPGFIHLKINTTLESLDHTRIHLLMQAKGLENVGTVDFMCVSGQEGSMTSTSASGRRRWNGGMEADMNRQRINDIVVCVWGEGFALCLLACA